MSHKIEWLTWRRLSLFVFFLWREWEPKSCGIPDPYRCQYRFTIRAAWELATELADNWDLPIEGLDKRTKP